ncbi:MAG: efflux transporter outer membrane subunit [Acidobacteria bacterium]|nr:efflux transporter outer membrane subunit [Acidobacteriota bacterium]MCY3963586.1 efflux transporter outer membrane subunit [Acidobacteriota bacterium]
MLRALVLASVLILWLGCSVASTPPILEAPAPARYGDGAGGAEAPTGSSQVAPDWWTDFRDPLLSQFIVEGLEHNASLLAAASNVETAFAQARLDGAARRPELEAALDPARRRQNTAQSGLTEAIPIPIPGFEPGGVRSFSFTSYGLALNVRWEVDLWGRLRALTAASLAEAAAGEADLEGARLSIAGQLAKVYFGVVEAVQQVELLERTLASRERTRDRVVARYRRGVATALEVRQARAQIAAVEASLAAQQQALDGLRRQMEVLLGRYPAGEIEAAPGLPALPGLPSTGVPADLLARRPDLRAAEYRAIASSQRIRAARRSLYPTFRLEGSSGTSSGELGDLLDGDFSVWSLAAGLLQPLLSGGRLRAGLDLVTAGLDAAEANWLQTALAAFAEVESGLAAERMLAEQTEALQRAATESREAERLAEGRYRQGLVGYLQVLDSQRTSFESERQLLAARRQQLESRTDLILALGGGLDREAAGLAAAGGG